jgi:hypothetical protein
MAKRKKQPVFTAAGVPRPGQPQPSRHETAVLRRIARGHLLVAPLEQGSSYSYEDGSPVLDEKGRPLDDTDFVRLQRWLVPDRGDVLFPETQPQRWGAKKPGG